MVAEVRSEPARGAYDNTARTATKSMHVHTRVVEYSRMRSSIKHIKANYSVLEYELVAGVHEHVACKCQQNADYY